MHCFFVFADMTENVLFEQKKNEEECSMTLSVCQQQVETKYAQNESTQITTQRAEVT